MANSDVMGRFYETTFYDSPSEDVLIGFQVLASPATINDQRIAYEELLRDFGRSTPVDQVGGLVTALALVGDPTSEWNQSGAERVLRPSLTPFPPDRVEFLLDIPVFAAETSPIGAKSLADLAALASGASVVVLGGLPAVVLVGPAIGLVVVRGLAAVSGALWEGARPEVAEFAGDVSRSLLDGLRRRLRIARRTG